MTIEYKQALTELNIILKYMNIQHTTKIPKKLVSFVSDNMDKSYTPNIKVNIPISEQSLKEDTKVLLSLIYRNYLCTEERKNELIQEDIYKQDKKEIDLREKYNPDNVFKNRKIRKNAQQKEVALVEVKEETFIRKIINKIRTLFKK